MRKMLINALGCSKMKYLILYRIEVPVRVTREIYREINLRT